jgi:hypothetical protein
MWVFRVLCLGSIGTVKITPVLLPLRLDGRCALAVRSLTLFPPQGGRRQISLSLVTGPNTVVLVVAVVVLVFLQPCDHLGPTAKYYMMARGVLVVYR